jgi:hypothetical protein
MFDRFLGRNKPSQAPEPDPSRIDRLGYSLCAMLDLAKRNGLFEEEEIFPIIPEALPLLSRASDHFLGIIQSQPPHLLETLMCHSCRYLWGKAVEAAFLWAKSPDGDISLNFEAGHMAEQIIETDLPPKLEKIVKSSSEEFLVYFQAHQNAMIQYQGRMTPEHRGREIAVTLEYFPRLGMAYAISKGYHETSW